MKALVWHATGDIRLDDVAEPQIEQPTDAVIRLTASAICGTDLHFIRGTFSDMKAGTILGHEGVGIIEQLGDQVRNFDVGDRVVVCSTLSCGYCPPCRSGNTAQCDNANPNGPQAGTCFFGGPQATGPVNGLQAEKARIPFASNTLVKVPQEVSDEQAILVSDIFPTGWFGAEIADITRGDTVAVFGCGPVGQFTIASALLMGAGRVIAVDSHDDRLAMARRQGPLPSISIKKIRWKPLHYSPVGWVLILLLTPLVLIVSTLTMARRLSKPNRKQSNTVRKCNRWRRTMRSISMSRTETGFRAMRRARRWNGRFRG
jgi:threonine dehydrogenase-like Zn-dependent dehydrogenase